METVIEPTEVGGFSMDQNEPAGMIVRTYAAELTAGEGRTVDVRIVPYGERATVADGLGGKPRGIPYEEEWVQGVFAHQLNAANRVLANFEHQSGIAGVVGHGLTLRDANDGFYGSFKLHETADGDKALMLVREGVLGGVSLEAAPAPKGSRLSTTGVVQRFKAHLKAIALCREPAFSGAQVLAVREAEILDEELPEELRPVGINPEVVERCRRLGIRLPRRIEEAHPAETGTPASAGTPEDGTRPETT